MKHKIKRTLDLRFLWPAIFVLSLDAQSGVQQSGVQEKPTAVMVAATNIGGNVIFQIAPIMRNGVGHSINLKLCEAAQSATVATNLGGLWLVLSSPTNRYSAFQAKPVTVTVFNGTLSDVNFRSSPLPEDTTGFGRFFITNQTNLTGYSYSGQCLAGFNRIRPQGLTECRLASLNPKSFHFDMTVAFGITNIGTYGFIFRGKLPSIFRPGEEIIFETAPLVLTIDSVGNFGP